MGRHPAPGSEEKPAAAAAREARARLVFFSASRQHDAFCRQVGLQVHLMFSGPGGRLPRGRPPLEGCGPGLCRRVLRGGGGRPLAGIRAAGRVSTKKSYFPQMDSYDFGVVVGGEITDGFDRAAGRNMGGKAPGPSSPTASRNTPARMTMIMTDTASGGRRTGFCRPHWQGLRAAADKFAGPRTNMFMAWWQKPGVRGSFSTELYIYRVVVVLCRATPVDAFAITEALCNFHLPCRVTYDRKDIATHFREVLSSRKNNAATSL